jgi:hypothetical protein
LPPTLAAHRRPNRPRLLTLVGLLAVLLFASLPAASIHAKTLPAGKADRGLYTPVLAPVRDQIYDATATLTRDRIDAIFSPAQGDQLAQITGMLDLHYVNDTGKPLSTIYFRLYPNTDEYGPGSMSIESAVSGSTTLSVRLSVQDTVATVTLPAMAAAGDAADLELGFTTTIPTNPVGTYGMFELDQRSGTYALAHWLPLLAGFDSEIGWELDPPSRIGDPVFTNTALFDVQLTAPSAFTFVTTGSQIASDDAGNGLTRHHYLSGPVRDFVMAADDDFRVVSKKVGGTTVNSYFNPDSGDGGQAVLTAGAQALETYGKLFGTYPYQEMDLVQVSLGNGAGGVEFPQMVFIGSSYYDVSQASQLVPRFLEFVVAHEVAHQWWYALVGDNQYLHAFMDEAMANYSTIVYFGERYGADAAEEQINYNLKAQYFNELFNDRDEIVDQPTDGFPSSRSYGATVYGKGALAFGAIRAEIGDDAFFAALQSYLRDEEFAVATPDELKAELETASGENLDALWRHWFDAAEGSQDYDATDLANLLKAIGR